MARSLPTWVGNTHDTAIPRRVRLRIWEKADGHCASCKRQIMVGEKWDCDHVRALINGGANSEDNLQVLCSWCHKHKKTRDDVAIKSFNYRRRLAHAGIRRRKSRPMPFGKADHFKKKVTGEVVARRLRVKW